MSVSLRTKQKGWKSILALTLTAAVSLAGCGSSQGGAAGGSQGPEAEGPTEISVMSAFTTANPPDPNGEVQKAIEEATDTKLNIQWVSSNNYEDRLNVILSSGDTPDLVMIDDPFSSIFRTQVEQGAFWDLTPYYPEYENISTLISEDAWEFTKMKDGKNYGVPRPRPAEGARFFVIRKDWLDKLGLQVPTTTDELYTAMKAFKEQDPDGNGQDDTIGFTGNVTASTMGTLGIFVNSFTGAAGNWKEQDGKLVYADFLPETKQALEYLNKAYAEGLIPGDFASLQASQVDELYASGKAGIIADKTGNMLEVVGLLSQVDPSAKDYNAFYTVTSINGFNPKGPGFLGMLAIPKRVPEEKMKKILQMIDTWMSPEVFALQTWGIEGKHHTVKDGQKELISEEYAKAGLANYNQIVYVANPYDSSFHSTFPQEAIEFYTKMQDERAKTSVADPSIGLFSETFQMYGPELEKQAQDVKTKVILGVSPISAWDEFVEELRANPQMTKIVEEMNESYAARTGGQ